MKDKTLLDVQQYFTFYLLWKTANALVPDFSRSIRHLHLTVWTVYYWLIHDSKKKRLLIITQYIVIEITFFKELLSVKT